MVLRPGRLYATAAIACSAMYLLLLRVLSSPEDSALAGMATAVILRLLAMRYELTLPVVAVAPDVSAEHKAIGGGPEQPPPGA
jgi:uncharacterized membrane protein YeiH